LSFVTDGKDGKGLNLENDGPASSSFNAMPAKLTKNIFCLMLPSEINCLIPS